jgi:hypothetical protein
VQAYVKNLLSGSPLADTLVTPPKLAGLLEQDCKKALQLVNKIHIPANGLLLYEAADVKAWANLGLYFAEKLRGAVALHTYRSAGGEENKQRAIRHLEASLRYWDEVVAITRPLYNDMPLVHLPGEVRSRSLLPLKSRLSGPSVPDNWSVLAEYALVENTMGGPFYPDC